MPPKLDRQPTRVIRAASGAAANNPPILATEVQTPVRVPNSLGRNHWAMIFAALTYSVDIPIPVRAHPKSATGKVGARANSSCPTPAMSKKVATVRRGPMASARTPASGCMRAKGHR
jgi:hypothetical protein